MVCYSAQRNSNVEVGDDNVNTVNSINTDYLLHLLRELDLQTQNLLPVLSCNCFALGQTCAVCKLEQVRNQISAVQSDADQSS